MELEGKNYSLVIKNLAEEIDPSKSHFKVKTGTWHILIVLWNFYY